MSRAPEKLRAWAEVDLGSLERNLASIRAALPPYLKYIAVVKADAYGHGMPAVATRLMRGGADMFAVANLAEAAALREIGTGWPILLLSAVLPSEDRDLVTYQATPTVSGYEEVERFGRLGEQQGKPFHVHLKVDTGMGRLGIWHDEALALYQAIVAHPHLSLEGIYTHFSSADVDNAYTVAQRDLFVRTLERFPGLDPSKVLIHADNSGGLETFPRTGIFRGVRIGLLQYGVGPYPRSLLGSAKVYPVFSFHARVGLVKSLPEGASVSYGRSYTLKRRSQLAVLTAGYGDGVPTTLSNRGVVLIRGHRCPIIGRVTMDQTIVDVTDLDGAVAPGELATLVGQQGDERITVVEFSRMSGQVPWEVFCGVTKRVERLYKTDTAV